MKPTLIALVAGLFWLFAAPVEAHHAEPLYDMKNPATLKGEVARVAWGNPHVYIYVIVKSEGVADDWSLELTSPNALKHSGWAASTVKPGDQIVCTGGRSKSQARTMRCATIELPDGRKLKS